MMRVIGTKTHAYLDYIMGVLLIIAPWVFGFYQGGAETWIPVIFGSGTIIYSLLTNYELSVWRMMSMRTHLNLDMINGALLAASPWLFSFAADVRQPHVILGLIEIGIALISKREPFAERKQTTHTATLH
ncbi:SPW repeat domain-containing protein [Chitinophaga japonensis]|uniref:SPW repeat-containing protein n=1 Tax=Chitinophaga japonensis TaxID=104662 RepID=A0A562SUV2_CHIJA|nr:SPW repeat protein [Chitinophaga japonensis]TWI84476.1 SPW repeat-containing protein [Chitinophaga japonensis]